jgi:general secretion pathway protein C
LKSILFSQRNIFYLNALTGIVLIIATLFFMRDIFSTYAGRQKTLKRDVPASKNTLTGRQKTQLTDYASILKNNPFGFPGGELKPLTGSSPEADTRRADIHLLGTIVGPKSLSYGVFKNSSGLQELFRVGDPVFGIGKLSKVERDKVIIRQGGKSIEIPIEDVKVEEIKQPGAGGPPFTSSFAQKVGKDTYMVDQRNVQQAIANPGQIMTDARLRPNTVNGKGEGFMLSEVRQGGIYNSLGLQNGDVLLRINEYDISNPERALQAFTALKGMDRVQIDMIRDGARMTMTYQIK